MRRSVWLALGFAAACFVGAYLFSGVWLLLLGIGAMLTAVGCAFSGNKAGRCAAWAFLGIAVASVWVFALDHFYLSDIRALDDQTVEAAVEITDYSYETDYGIAADGKVMLEEKTYRIRIYLYENISLIPGQSVEGELHLRYTPRGGLDEMTHHQGKGIYLLGYFRDEATVSEGDSDKFQYFPAKLRKNIKDTLDEIFPEDTAAFARALLLGDSSLLGYEDNTALSVSGIRHIVAVSGLHVSILFSIILSVFGYRRVWTPLIGLPLLVLIAALAGFTPSVSRACIMQGLMLLALAADKEYDPPSALAFSVLVMLAVNPLMVTSVSFQLSVGCIIGILSFSEKLRLRMLKGRWLGEAKGKGLKVRIKRWICGSVSVSLSATVVTMPLCALHFDMVSLVSVLTNLVCLWAVTVLFCLIIAACVVYAAVPVLGRAMAWLASWFIRAILFVAKTLASIPYAAVYTQSVYIVIWLVLCYVLLAVFLLGKVRHTKMMLSCAAAGLCLALVFSWVEPRLDTYRVTALDVGDGQCVLLQNRGKTYIVDCGGDFADDAADQAAHTLLSQGIRSVEGIIVTHYDTDHSGGVAKLMSQIRVKKVYLPLTEGIDPVAAQIEAAATEVYKIEPEQILRIPEGNITVFSGKEGASDNESSLCVLFQPENCDILIMADRSIAGERELMEQTQLPDLEVLIVGHHGSKTSTGVELLSTTRPEIAVISVGEDNRYGHPAPQVLDRLERYGCLVLRTDQQGDVVIRG